PPAPPRSGFVDRKAELSPNLEGCQHGDEPEAESLEYQAGRVPTAGMEHVGENARRLGAPGAEEAPDGDLDETVIGLDAQHLTPVDAMTNHGQASVWAPSELPAAWTRSWAAALNR